MNARGDGVGATGAAPRPIERLEESLGELVVDLVEEAERRVRAALDELARRPGAGVVEVQRDQRRRMLGIDQDVGELLVVHGQLGDVLLAKDHAVADVAGRC